MARMALASAQDARSLRGAVFEVHLVPVDHQLYKAMEAAGSMYSEAVSKLSAEDKRAGVLGIPAYHKWSGMVQYYSEVEGVDEQRRGMIREYLEAIAKLSKEDKFNRLAEAIRHFAVRKAYSREVKNLEIRVEAHTDEGVLWRRSLRPQMRREAGIRETRGAAPAGDMERRLQGFLM